MMVFSQCKEDAANKCFQSAEEKRRIKSNMSPINPKDVFEYSEVSGGVINDSSNPNCPIQHLNKLKSAYSRFSYVGTSQAIDVSDPTEAPPRENIPVTALSEKWNTMLKLESMDSMKRKINTGCCQESVSIDKVLIDSRWRRHLYMQTSYVGQFYDHLQRLWCQWQQIGESSEVFSSDMLLAQNWESNIRHIVSHVSSRRSRHLTARERLVPWRIRFEDEQLDTLDGCDELQFAWLAAREFPDQVSEFSLFAQFVQCSLDQVRQWTVCPCIRIG